MMKEQLIYLNGQFVNKKDAVVPVYDQIHDLPEEIMLRDVSDGQTVKSYTPFLSIYGEFCI